MFAGFIALGFIAQLIVDGAAVEHVAGTWIDDEDFGGALNAKRLGERLILVLDDGEVDAELLGFPGDAAADRPGCWN